METPHSISGKIHLLLTDCIKWLDARCFIRTLLTELTGLPQISELLGYNYCLSINQASLLLCPRKQ